MHCLSISDSLRLLILCDWFYPKFTYFVLLIWGQDLLFHRFARHSWLNDWNVHDLIRQRRREHGSLIKILTFLVSAWRYFGQTWPRGHGNELKPLGSSLSFTEMRVRCWCTTDNKRSNLWKKELPGDFYLFLPHMFYKIWQQGVVLGMFYVIREKPLLSITSAAPSSVTAQEMNSSRLAPVGPHHTGFS